MREREDFETMVAQAMQSACLNLDPETLTTGVMVGVFGVVKGAHQIGIGFCVKNHTKMEFVRDRMIETMEQVAMMVVTPPPGEPDPEGTLQ